jgi:hypothetical protein
VIAVPPGNDAATGHLPRYAFAYETCDIPPGMTISEFRALRSRANAATTPRINAAAMRTAVLARGRAFLGRAHRQLVPWRDRRAGSPPVSDQVIVLQS